MEPHPVTGSLCLRMHAYEENLHSGPQTCRLAEYVPKEMLKYKISILNI